jgi:hypothetical protein
MRSLATIAVLVTMPKFGGQSVDAEEASAQLPLIRNASQIRGKIGVHVDQAQMGCDQVDVPATVAELTVYPLRRHDNFTE